MGGPAAAADARAAAAADVRLAEAQAGLLAGPAKIAVRNCGVAGAGGLDCGESG